MDQTNLIMLAQTIIGGIVTILALVVLWRAVERLYKSRPPESPPLLPPSTPQSLENLREAIKKFVEEDDTMPLLDFLQSVGDPIFADFISKVAQLSTIKPKDPDVGKVGTATVEAIDGAELTVTSVVHIDTEEVLGVDSATKSVLVEEGDTKEISPIPPTS